MCQCVARPARDDEDGGHLSRVCREEELPIEAGVDVLSNRNYLYPVAPNSWGCAGLLLAIWLVSFFRTKTRNEFWDYAPVTVRME